MITTQVIKGGIDKFLESEKKSFPQYTHRASSIGHPCSRFLYYSIHDWEKSAPVNNSMLGIFKTGQLLEDKLVVIFNENIGPRCTPQLRIVKTQTQIRDKLLEKYKISGTCDGILQELQGDKWVDMGIVDLKTCSSNLFASYDDLSSLKRHTWSSMYASQVMTYAFASNYERGYLLFVSKGNLYNDWKIVEVPVDMEHVESLLKKCEQVNVFLRADNDNFVPPRLNKPLWCADCRWESLCLPEIEYDGSGPKVNEDSEIELMVKRLRELKPYTREHDSLQKLLKKALVPGQGLILKNSIIDWTQVNGTKQPCKGGPFSYWKMSVKSTGDNDDDDEDE